MSLTPTFNFYVLLNLYSYVGHNIGNKSIKSIAIGGFVEMERALLYIRHIGLKVREGF